MPRLPHGPHCRTQEGRGDLMDMLNLFGVFIIVLYIAIVMLWEHV